MKRPEEIDHCLEQLWLLQEESGPCDGAASESAAVSENIPPLATDDALETLGYLESEGLTRKNGNGYELTPIGTARAEGLIRRHRLAEVLLTELFDVQISEARSDVCRLEHVLSPSLADRICTFLGHPPHCPHGRPIPRGSCCSKRAKEVPVLVLPLSEARVGQDFKVSYIRHDSQHTLDRLAVLGLSPGADLHLFQKKPSYVLRVGETDIAVDNDIAKVVFVKPA